MLGRLPRDMNVQMGMTVAVGMPMEGGLGEAPPIQYQGPSGQPL